METYQRLGGTLGKSVKRAIHAETCEICGSKLETDPESGLYRISLEVSWKEGRRNVTTTRSAYAIYRKTE